MGTNILNFIASSGCKIAEIIPNFESIWKLLMGLLDFILGFITCVYHTLIILILSPLFLYRWVIIKSCRFLNPSLGNMVIPRSHLFSTENFTSTKPSRAVIVITSILEGELKLAEVRNQLLIRTVNAKVSEDETQLKYPELQQYITTWPRFLGFRFWKPERNFNIQDHVVRYQPTHIFTDSQLESWMETLINQPFEKEKSPWKVFVTNNYINPEISTKRMTVIIMKTHHCLSDGFGISHMLTNTLAGQMPILPEPKYREPDNLSRIFSCIKFPFELVFELSKFAAQTWAPHPWKIRDEQKSWKQLYCKSRIIPIEKIKVIKNKFGVCFSSVLLSAYAAASHYTLEDERQKQLTRVEEYLPTIFILPLPDHPKTLCNHCCAASINIPVRRYTPVKRLLECDKLVHQAKRPVFPFLGKYLPIIAGSFPSTLSKFLGQNRQFPVGFSNFPICAKSFNLFNRKMLHMPVGTGGQVGVLGMNFLVYTYGNGIQFTVTAESALISRERLKYMVQLIEDEIDTLSNTLEL